MSNHESYDREMRVYQEQVDELFKSSPDLVTVPRAELEAWRDAMTVCAQTILEVSSAQSRGASWYTNGASGLYQTVATHLCRAKAANTEALAKLEAHLKGQP